MTRAFQVNVKDNVAVIVDWTDEKNVEVMCESGNYELTSLEDIPKGHKIAIRNIQEGENIVKYGVNIGVATKDIEKGQWVHLQCMKSFCDERSSHLDIHTGEPSDIEY